MRNQKRFLILFFRESAAAAKARADTPLLPRDDPVASSHLQLTSGAPARDASPASSLSLFDPDLLPDPSGVSRAELDLRAATAAFCRRGREEEEEGTDGAVVLRRRLEERERVVLEQEEALRECGREIQRLRAGAGEATIK